MCLHEQHMKTFKTIALVFLLAAPVAACKKKSGDAGGGGVGVAECDDYLTRMDNCAKKMAGKGGEQLTKMANMMRKAWAEDVKDAEKKKDMPAGCVTAVKDMQKQMPECDWGIAPAPTEGSAPAPTEGSGSAAAPTPTEGSAGSGSAAAPAGSATP
jgi:hypothetical protein